MSRFLELLAREWPRRRIALSIAGGGWVAYGLAIVTSPNPYSRLGVLTATFDDVLGSPWGGVGWLLLGSIGLCVGLTGRRDIDALGWGSVVAVPMIWGLLAAASWLTWVATGGVFGNGRAWGSAVLWFVPTALLFLISGMADPQAQAATATDSDEV